MGIDTDMAEEAAPREEGGSPLECFLSRRATVLGGLRRVAGSVAAVFGPRPVRLLRADGSPEVGIPRCTAQVFEALGPLDPAEARGAAPLRLAAALVDRRVGAGSGAAVCLTAAMILRAIEAMDAGTPASELLAGLDATVERLREELPALARAPRDAELAELLAEGLPARPEGAAAPLEDPEHLEGLRHAKFLVVGGSIRGLEWRSLRGALALLAPQGRFVLPEVGRSDGRHRVLGLRGPLRTEAEVGALFGSLGCFEEPLLLLADRLSPRAATRAASLSLGGHIHGHVLWMAPEETGTHWVEAASRALGAPVLDDPREAADLDPRELGEVSAVHFLGKVAVLEPADPDRRARAPRFDVLLHGGAEAEQERLSRAARLVELARLQGVVPGGCATYLALVRSLGETPAERVLADALETPLRTLVENEGMDPDAVLDRLASLAPGSGYDVLGRAYFDPAEGPATPVAVVDEVLAASVHATVRFLAGGSWTLGMGGGHAA